MFVDYLIGEAIDYNIKNGIPLSVCVFRRESEKFYEYYNFLRENQNRFNLDGWDKRLLETDIGKIGLYEGKEVPLDLPFVEDDNPCWPGYVMVKLKKCISCAKMVLLEGLKIIWRKSHTK